MALLSSPVVVVADTDRVGGAGVPLAPPLPRRVGGDRVAAALAAVALHVAIAAMLLGLSRNPTREVSSAGVAMVFVPLSPAALPDAAVLPAAISPPPPLATASSPAVVEPAAPPPLAPAPPLRPEPASPLVPAAALPTPPEPASPAVSARAARRPAVAKPASRPQPLPPRRDDVDPAPRQSPVPAPTTAPAAPPQPVGPDLGQAWRSSLAAWLREHQTYPDAARRDGTEGRVLVRFTVRRDGTVTQAALLQSSGSAILDDAALAMLQTGRLPAFPPGMAPEALTVTVPIRYRLAP